MDKNQWLDPQPWERDVDAPCLSLGAAGQFDATHLFAPCVALENERYYMWYSGYSSYPPEVMQTSIGFAVSEDGLNWTKSPHNPIFGPDPSRPWESHFTTSHSLLRLADGSLRLWYASRTKPPFVHKYYAIGTARWPA